jgi:hypothetical protein
MARRARKGERIGLSYPGEVESVIAKSLSFELCKCWSLKGYRVVIYAGDTIQHALMNPPHGMYTTPFGMPLWVCLTVHPCGTASAHGLLSTSKAPGGCKVAGSSSVAVSSRGQSVVCLTLTMCSSCTLLSDVSVASAPPGSQDPQVQEVCYLLARLGIMHLVVGPPGMIPRVVWPMCVCSDVLG